VVDAGGVAVTVGGGVCDGGGVVAAGVLAGGVVAGGVVAGADGLVDGPAELGHGLGCTVGGLLGQCWTPQLGGLWWPAYACVGANSTSRTAANAASPTATTRRGRFIGFPLEKRCRYDEWQRIGIEAAYGTDCLRSVHLVAVAHQVERRPQ
jgi:hypothetical protein